MRFWLGMLLVFVGMLISMLITQNGNLIFLAGYLVGLLVYWMQAKVRQGGE